MSRLYQIAGLEQVPASDVVGGQVEVDGDQFADLVAAASLFLRGGGQVTPAWWAEQDPIEQLALAEAGDRLRSSWAASIGLAGQGREGAAAALARADGGAAVVRSALQGAADQVARSAAGGCP